MILTILGSGSAIPSLKRSGPAYLLKIPVRGGSALGEKADLILLDAGPGTLRQFEKARKDYFKLTHILISHTHADHLTDLIAILQSMYGRTQKLMGDKREKPLIIVGPPGFKKVYQNLRKAMMPEKESYQVQVHEMGNNSLKDFKNWKLESKIIRHVEFWDSVAYKIIAGDKIFVYSGDTGFCPEIIEFCKGADSLLIEATLPISCEFPKDHLNPQFASEIATLSGAKKIILTHLYSELLGLDSSTEIKKEVAKKFKGKIIIAKDLEKISL